MMSVVTMIAVILRDRGVSSIPQNLAI